MSHIFALQTERPHKAREVPLSELAPRWDKFTYTGCTPYTKLYYVHQTVFTGLLCAWAKNIATLSHAGLSMKEKTFVSTMD
jgi:hypothetical protein